MKHAHLTPRPPAPPVLIHMRDWLKLPEHLRPIGENQEILVMSGQRAVPAQILR